MNSEKPLGNSREELSRGCTIKGNFFHVILHLCVLVKDVMFALGCGNGKYLSVNHSIFKIGVDRCKRFTDIAREKENEVHISIESFSFLN